jgi:tetratricopeptide (TPR) repeat protein
MALRGLFKFFLIPVLVLNFSFAFAQNNDIQLANEYYRNSDFEKAKVIFEKVVKDKKNIPLVHKNYLSTLYALDNSTEAEKYLKKLVRDFPDNPYYRIDYAIHFQKENKTQEADKYLTRFINEIAGDEGKVRLATQYLNDNRLYEYSEKAYLEARRQQNNKNLFSYELANIYIYTQNLNLVVEELVNIASTNPSAVDMIKNSLQNMVKKDEDYQKLEKIFLSNVQSKPQEILYPELLLWLYTQEKQFYKAFIQARALDKRTKSEGEKLIELGLIAFQNKSYEDASTIFQYIIDNYAKSVNYIIAKNYLISSKEEIVKNTYPTDYAKIKSLIADYNSLIKEVGLNPNTAESLRNMALLNAFYYQKLDTAISLIETAIKIPQLNPSTVSKFKLDMGDIYLLKGEPWEATLLYSQVEKAEKEKLMGYEAKLKNAKLSYYKGDFKLAQSHLDVLKLATSREIANDAMDLSLLIQDNIGMDSVEDALKEYAKVDLLLFQNKKEEALKALEEMKVKFANHTIIDEILFLEGKLFAETGNFERALSNFEAIYKNYSEEIYADDALFLVGKIYEENLKQRDKALEIYTSHLKDYPGSIYTAEVRKRLRKLRGDNIN